MIKKSPPPHKILIVEDDPGLNEQLASIVSRAGYQVESCFDGNSALLTACEQRHQLMLLDLMLPGRDGMSLLSMLRKTSQMPVIIVTAKGAEEERITGFQQGADDYVAKPFNTIELLLRIEALLRRSQPQVTHSLNTIAIDGLLLDFERQQASIHQAVVDLTSIQFKVLWELGLHRNDVLSKAYLSQQVLGRSLGAYDRGLDMHLSRLRRKLTQVGWRGDRLKTIHGKGYCLQ